MHNVLGGEGIILYKEYVILGMQKEKRWYDLDHNDKWALIKTIGGKIEREDHYSMKKALIREIKEELNLLSNDFQISHHCLFEKEILMSDLNPFEKKSDTKLKAKFYRVDISDKKDVLPCDLPFLLMIPIKEFINLEYNVIIESYTLKKYFISKNNNVNIPKYVSLFIPEEVKLYLRGLYE